MTSVKLSASKWGASPAEPPEVVPNQERHRPLSLQTADFGHVTRDGRIIQDGTYYRWSEKGDEIGMKGLERKIKRGRPFGITCCRLRLSRADSSCSFSCCHLQNTSLFFNVVLTTNPTTDPTILYSRIYKIHVWY